MISDRASSETDAGTLPVIVIGAGEAGSRCAQTLSAAGHPVLVVSPDGRPEVELPPLSKTLFAPDLTLTEHRLDPAKQSAAAADEHPSHSPVTVVTGEAAAIDLCALTVRLSTGERLTGSSIVIATGSRARTLDLELPGGPVFTLHSAAEAHAIRDALAEKGSSAPGDSAAPADIGIIGSGFLALELARGAADAGHRVTVHLNGPRPLPRLSKALAAAVMGLHESADVRFVPRSTPADYAPHDLWLTAVGARADTAFAGEGVQRSSTGALLTDARLRLLDSAGEPVDGIFAIGDCAQVAHGPMGIHSPLESEPMAASQGEWLGAHLARAAGDPWTDLPWHWSFQGPVRVFTAGLSAEASQGEPVVLGDLSTGRGQVALFASAADDAPLVGVETLGPPKPHLAARRLLASGTVPTRAQVSAPGFDLVAASRLPGRRPPIA